MKWMHLVVFCATVAVPIYARPGPNEFTHSSPINVTEETAVVTVPDIPAVFTKENESLLRRTQDTNIGTIETIEQTESKTKSDEIPLETSLNRNDSNISTGTISVNEKRHLGIAVPVTMEELEKEMASKNVRETSTSKDGISTWILLSGTNPTTPPEMSRSGAESVKVDKIAKIRDNSKAPNKAILKTPQSSKNKTKPKATTPLPLDVNEDNVNTNMDKNEKLPEPVPTRETPILKPKKKLTTTTTTPQPQLNEETVTNMMEDDMLTATTKETPVPFLVLEPKDADFDLPQDRSPGKTPTKKPKRNNNKTKKKNNKTPNGTHLEDVKNSTKVAIKKKENPIGTKIYNYLSREVMPTAAVGLLGLVVTAGIAGYFLGPLGALRRSYEIGDRKDDLYYYNNEEYAGTDGQSEEEVFGKVIAGMPLNGNHRNNIRYNAQAHRPNYYQQNQNPSKYQHQYSIRHRSTVNQQFQQQHPVQHPAQHPPQHPAQHPAQQLSYSYHPNTQNPANYQRVHHVAPATQNVVSQKSISNSIFAIQPAAHTTTTDTTTLPATVVHDINKLTNKDSEEVLKSTGIVEEENPNELKKRTQFVVGSVLPENVMDLNDDRDKIVVMPEHGPRRRRSVISGEPSQISVDNDVKALEESYANLKKRVEDAEKNEQISKEMKHIDYEINRLRRVIAEVKDIEQFYDELRIKGKNEMLRDTVSNGVIHITGNIEFVNELLDNPTEIDSKIANREAMLRTVKGEKPLNVTVQKVQKKSDHMITETFQPTEAPSGLMGLLKILELKAAFGVNVLRSIRPAFDRAFADVFHTEPEST